MTSNYYVTIQESLDSKNIIKFFVRAHSRANAQYKALNYPDARYFCENYPKCIINVFSAGVQAKCRAEGLVPDFLEGI